jgi:hypothetical protein
MDAYEKHTFTNSSGFMPYRLLKPKVVDASKKYPLVIMLHGEGEGIGQPCTNQYGLNVCNLLWGGKMHLDSIGKYPSYVVFPQTHGGDWKSDVYINLLIGILQNLFKTYPIDLDKISIHGLSGGGSGVYLMAARYPGLFAAVSPHSASGDPTQATRLEFNPLWTVQGENDGNPKQTVTLSFIDAERNLGHHAIFTYDLTSNKQRWPNPNTTNGEPVYTLVPNSGHVVWPKLYDSPTWLGWMYAQSKKQIVVIGRRNISPGETVKLGISPGYDAYQWSNGATSNSITVGSAGTYRVRYLRKSLFFSGSQVWSDWSDPVVISVNSSLGPVVDAGADSRVNISAGNTKLRGYGAGNHITYKWTKVSGGNVSISSANTNTPYISNFQTGTYVFRLTVSDASGRSASDDVKLIVFSTSAMIVSFGRMGDSTEMNSFMRDSITNQFNNIVLFPNPFTSEELKLKFPTSQSNVEVTVYDHMGIPVYNEKMNQYEGESEIILSLQHLPSDLYMVKINTDNISNKIIHLIKK